MGSNNLTIGFVRRGFSSGGGAESYIKRLARGVVAKGHDVRLYTSAEWPSEDWDFGPITRLDGKSAVAFADELEKLRQMPSWKSECDVLLSFERIWRCDIYRAGDGVHRAWLQRREETGGSLQKLSRLFNRKHASTITLEKSLFAENGAGRIIANSQMIRDEIVSFYGFAREKIELVYNGVPVDAFQQSSGSRDKTREMLGLKDEDIAVLFAGSGWERKGLRFAIEAVETSGKEMRLLVAGRGDKQKFRSNRLRFLDVVKDMPSLYGAADIFLLPTIYDPFSNACLEALAAGLPVVTTRANGFSEIMGNGIHGTIVDDPCDIRVMREALQTWSNPFHRGQAKAANMALARQFDIAANVERTLEILISCAAK